MTQRSNSAQSGPLVSDERLRNALREQIQIAFHIDNSFTRDTLAERSGVNIYQIDAINSRDPAKRRPIHATEALSLAFVIGPRAVNAVMALIGYVGTPLEEGRGAQPTQIVAQAMASLAVIASAAADNRFDHSELPGVECAADDLIEIMTPISSRRGA